MKRINATLGAFLMLNCTLVAADDRLEELQRELAKEQIKQLDRAVKLHYLCQGKYPKTLRILTEVPNPKHRVKKEQLLDPWKKKYCYDLAGKRNNGKKPDIWTDAPNNKIIGNWMFKGSDNGRPSPKKSPEVQSRKSNAQLFYALDVEIGSTRVLTSCW